MDEAVARIEQAVAAVAPTIRAVDAAQLVLLTPCDDWDLQTLLQHLFEQLNQWAGAISGSEPPAGGAILRTSDDVGSAWEAASQALMRSVTVPGALDAMVPEGKSSPRGLASIAPLEVMLHGWDAARTIGVSTDLGPLLCAALLDSGRQMMAGRPRGEAFGPEQPAPDGATAADRLAAFYGRRV